MDNYEMIFRELFCVAASALAAKMSDDLTNVGVLWDEIFHTGGMEATMQPRRPSTRLSTAPTTP